MNLSFAGCGFLGIYHVGVAVCFRQYAPHLLLEKISGASAGALAACSLLCDIPIGDLASDVLKVATEARKRSLGPFHPNFNIQKLLLEGLDKVLPEDAHLMVNGKLHVSLTRVYDGKNIILSHFNSREELMQALNASCFIPLFSGILPPKVQGVRYMDGGFSDNLPTLDENTITVSPFCGESDICPRDDSMQLFHINIANTSIELSKHNIYRIGRILFPPSTEILSNMCKQGFDDALRFLHRNNLINCTRCLSVQSTFTIQTTIDDTVDFDPECNECKLHRQTALVSNLPDAVLSIFQEAIDSANKGLANWIFRHRGMKLLSVLTMPYTVPADLMVATFTNAVGDTIEKHKLEYRIVTRTHVNPIENKCKCGRLINNERLIGTVPKMGTKIWDLSTYFMNQLKYILNKVQNVKDPESRRITISCKTNYNEMLGDLDLESGNQCKFNVKSRPNITYTVDNDRNVVRASTSRPLSRRSSLLICSTGECTVYDDTFENILQVTTNNEAIMTYYYLDENNKLKMTEIYDVTESDSPAVQSHRERELNQQLEFDDDFEASVWMTGPSCEYSIEDENDGVEIIALDEILDHSSIFSDPESEWTNGKIELDDELDDSRPESDQPSNESETLRKPFQIPPFTFNEHSM